MAYDNFGYKIFLLEQREKQRQRLNVFEEPIREFRCEHCDIQPTYDYLETYHCTLHFHQLKKRVYEHAKEYQLELPVVKRIVKTLQKENGDLVHYYVKEI